MNIFVLDTEPKMAARALYDSHVVKMPLEYAQILSTAARMRGFEHGGYRNTHTNHPCVKWAARDMDHWSWLYNLALWTGEEYRERYGKTHASTEALALLPLHMRIEAAQATVVPRTFVLAMPEEYRREDPIEAYREYYRKGKAHLKKYRAPAVEPSWL